ncbi:hypothetical protein BU25DRAFT_459714 [Macroventuria anomochaeta]|uniref:Uncharacterized protein n=1 Tax=Macroventuria anomochaeta TaxID=301207 RepID=A0ACB6RW26_9PLEO|nr:uncharacterized protein BU25DRAFT_459714 [Macroventuria anomochaeta]KAF2626175.1 hypothetical protein BU25DRAFT_459714 [Macroventuria anomochaeta]
MSSVTLSPLAQSADKQLLFARLGLNEQVHKLLLGEAQAARDRLSRSEHNLTDQSRADPSVTAPYKWDEISETAKHYEILTVVNNAGPQTRPYYGMGRYVTNVNEENWVARWYLWHSFRYRDNRDNRTRGAANNGNRAYGGKDSDGLQHCGRLL